MDYLTGVLLGLIQGVTEFLPISSSGHLVMVRDVLAVSDTHALAIDAVLHLATTCAIIVYFRSDIWMLVQALIRKLGRLPVNERDLVLVKALAAGTVPGVLLGLLLEDVMSQFESATVVAVVLFCSALFFMYAEWRHYQAPQRRELTVKIGLLVGVFQALALIPGFSRSGATLAGGMLLGLSRLESARFSFLLAIPITLGVGLKKLLELILTSETVSWGPILVGAAVSFVMALIVIHFFLAFIRRYTLWPFIWYSVILAALVGYVAVFVY
jgi:undecaprenyl-diphosphatase